MNRGVFEFRGSGFGYIWLLAWTLFLSVITGGLFFPWAYSAQQRWIASNTYLNGQTERNMLHVFRQSYFQAPI